jgi:hypothetical protein
LHFARAQGHLPAANFRNQIVVERAAASAHATTAKLIAARAAPHVDSATKLGPPPARLTTPTPPVALTMWLLPKSATLQIVTIFCGLQRNFFETLAVLAPSSRFGAALGLAISARSSTRESSIVQFRRALSRSIFNRPPKKPETFRPPASLLNEPKGRGAKVFWIIATVVLTAAVTYEFLQSLNRFNALTRDDVPNASKPTPATSREPKSALFL